MSNNHHGKLIGVVIRYSHQHRPTVSTIIQQSNDKDVDDQIHYLISQGKEHVQEFKNTFVEFKRADWYIDVIEEATNKLIATEEIRANPPVKP